MKFYLCHFLLHVHEYPDSSYTEPWTSRIVKAESEEEAERKLREKVEYDDPYCINKRIESLEIHEVIE